MKKNLITVIVVIGLALILVGISLLIFPEWLNVSGGVLVLLGIAVVTVVALGGGLKDWRDFLFWQNADEKPASNGGTSERSQDMKRSSGGEQTMGEAEGKQKQTMTESPGGKQKME